MVSKPSLADLEVRLAKIEEAIASPIYPSNRCPNCENEVGVKWEAAKDNKIVNAAGTHIIRQATCGQCDHQWKTMFRLT